MLISLQQCLFTGYVIKYQQPKENIVNILFEIGYHDITITNSYYSF